MAFPYSTIENFESGALGEFDSETDTGSRLDFPHYTDLARTPNIAMPYNGAYCMRVDLSSTNDAYAVDEAWNVTTATQECYVRFRFWLSPNIVMGNTNTLALMKLVGAASAVQASIWLTYTTAAGYTIGIGQTAATSTTPVSLGQWHSVEMYVNPAAGTGTIDGWLDNASLTQVTTLTQIDITDGWIGVVDQEVETTAGTILYDDVVFHGGSDTGARIGNHGPRFPETLLMNKTGHAFVGHGILDNVSLYSGAGTDCVLQVWDTDTANVTDSSLMLTLKNLTNNETPVDPAGVPIELTRGCYIVLTGTDPQAEVKIRRAVGYGGDGAIRNYAFRR